jgi:hypothetical protein
MSEHDHIAGLLPLAGTGDLAPDEIRRVLEHVAGCAQCRQANEDYALLGGALRSLTTPQPSAELLARVRVMAADRLARNPASGREAAMLAPLVAAAWVTALATWPWLRAAGRWAFSGWQLPGGMAASALATYSILGILLAAAAAAAVIRRAAANGRMQ